MAKRRSGRQSSGRRNSYRNDNTSWLSRHIGRSGIVAGLITTGVAFTSLFGLIAYGILVAHTIWSESPTWWVALTVSGAFFVYFAHHGRDDLQRCYGELRSGIGRILFAIAGFFFSAAIRLDQPNQNWRWGPSLKLIAKNLVAVLIVCATCTGTAEESAVVLAAPKSMETSPQLTREMFAPHPLGPPQTFEHPVGVLPEVAQQGQLPRSQPSAGHARIVHRRGTGSHVASRRPQQPEASRQENADDSAVDAYSPSLLPRYCDPLFLRSPLATPAQQLACGIHPPHR